jgi:hypothetical protein
MPQDLTHRTPRYHTFLLSLWEEAGSAPGWRCSLENPHTGERKGFKSLDELTAYLREWTQKPPPEQRPMNE